VNTIRNVRTAYVALTLSRSNLVVQQQSLELARQTLKDNRTRVEIGTMAPIDIVEAEAEVARNEEGVILAEAQIREAEDLLRSQIFDPSTPEFWATNLETAEEIPAPQPVVIDTNAAIQEALGKRTDLARFRKSIEITELNMKYYKNQTLPQVNLRLAYGAEGLGGEQAVREPGFPPGEVIGTAQRSFWDALGDEFTFDYPTWSTGVVVSMPIGTSAASVNLTRTELQYDQEKLELARLEMQVGLQVRDAVRTLETAYKRVDATRASRELSERRLEAEQKKFGVGMSTSFLVFQAQRDLALARTNELQAVYDYYRARVDFEAVMETSIGVVGSGVTVSSTSQ
jgi:outer membrane protein TolC